MKKLNKSKVAFIDSFVELRSLKGNAYQLEETYNELTDAKRGKLNYEDAALLHSLVNSSLIEKQ